MGQDESRAVHDGEGRFVSDLLMRLLITRVADGCDAVSFQIIC